MKTERTVRRHWLAGLLLTAGALATGGCSTYHYYDIDVQFGSVSLEEAGVLQICELDVTGADSHSTHLPSSTVGDKTTVCPIDRNWPDMGKFEFATFADSGTLTFKVTGYKGLPAGPATLCTTGTVDLPANSTITQSGTITMGTFDDTNCPTGVVHP